MTTNQTLCRLKTETETDRPSKDFYFKALHGLAHTNKNENEVR